METPQLPRLGSGSAETAVERIAGYLSGSQKVWVRQRAKTEDPINQRVPVGDTINDPYSQP